MALTGTVEALPGAITALSETLPGSTGNVVPGTTGNESFATVAGDECQEAK